MLRWASEQDFLPKKTALSSKRHLTISCKEVAVIKLYLTQSYHMINANTGDRLNELMIEFSNLELGRNGMQYDKSSFYLSHMMSDIRKSVERT